MVASRSRWLVGSSSSSRSGSRNSARASATRIRQPPENSPTGRACAAASKPRPASTVAARAGALSAPMAIRRSWISAERVRVRRRARSSLGQQRGALGIRGQHRVEQAVAARPALPAPHGRCGRGRPGGSRRHRAASSPVIASQQGGLAGAVAADQPDACRPGSTARSAPSSRARPAMRRVRLRMARTVMAGILQQRTRCRRAGLGGVRCRIGGPACLRHLRAMAPRVGAGTASARRIEAERACRRARPGCR